MFSSIFSSNIINDSFFQTNFERPNPVPVSSSSYNSKSVDRAEIEIQNLSGGVWLNYRIRFQNTGTGTVVNIRIQDSLSSFLDLNTFQFTGSSHQGQFILYTSGNMYIYYSAINLPDSTSGLSASQGSFRFRVQPKESLPVGTTIFNSAKIEFDFEPPVMTNTVRTDIINYASVSIMNINNAITVYPNPATDIIALNWFNELLVSQVNVIDITGQLLFKQSISVSHLENLNIDLTPFSKGFYFIKVNHQYGVSLIKIEKQ